MDDHPLKSFREKHDPKLTQEALAGLLGVSKAAVSRWENGIRKPDEDLLTLISERTGIPVGDLRPDLARLFTEAAE